MSCPFLLSLGAFSTSSKFPLVSGITVQLLKSGWTPLASMAVPWFSLALSAKGTPIPERKDHHVQCSAVVRARMGQADWTTACMDGWFRQEGSTFKAMGLVGGKGWRSLKTILHYLKGVVKWFDYSDYHGWSQWCQQNCLSVEKGFMASPKKTQDIN